MKNVLITGATGFAGSFLAEYLLQKGEYNISGTYLNEESIGNIAGIKDNINLHKVDLLDVDATHKLIKDTKPDLVFHLAALASAGESFSNPAKYLTNNISGQVNILEGIRSADISPRVLIISSAEVYGNIDQNDIPIDESTKLRPVNPYAVSKVAQDFLGLQYYYAYNIPTIIVRPFNHIGPRQSPSFAISSFAQKIARIEKGELDVLKVGNLSAKRDLSDARDIVRGYSMLLENGKIGEVYNIGRGVSYKIEDILNKLIKLSNKEIKVEVDDALLRPVDIPELLCDTQKIKNEIGFSTEIDIDTTLKDTLDYWRGII